MNIFDLCAFARLGLTARLTENELSNALARLHNVGKTMLALIAHRDEAVRDFRRFETSMAAAGRKLMGG